MPVTDENMTFLAEVIIIILHLKFSLLWWTGSRKRGEICEQICLSSQSALSNWNWLHLVKIDFLPAGPICCITTLTFIWWFFNIHISIPPMCL